MSDEKRVEIKKWSPVALWGWDVQIEMCAICKNHIQELCMRAHRNLD